jgi:hypothetical protein
VAGHQLGGPGTRWGALAAFLRIYEPLDTLASGYVAVHPSPSAGAAEPLSARDFARHERVAALRAASALPPRPVGDLDLMAKADHTPVLLLSPDPGDGVVRGCPADLTRRTQLALCALRGQFQPAVLHSLLPAHVFIEATDRAAIRRAAATPPHVRSSAWHIPLAWFVLFRPEGRLPEQEQPHVADAEAHQGADAEAHQGAALRSVARSIRYLASMADARRGLARTLAAVRRSPTGLLPTSDLEDLGRWLEEFHARSVVELDYGGLAELLGGDGDDSVAAVTAGVAVLRPGSFDDAVARLVAVRDRWTAVRALERAS